jgi:delta14-sterol reductase
MARSTPKKPVAEEVTTTITATTTLDLPTNVIPLTYEQLNPKSKPTEFLGPIGTAGATILTPTIAYLLFYGCNETYGCPALSAEGWGKTVTNDWRSINGWWWDWKAAGVYLAWYAYIVACWKFLPGEKVQGTSLRDGTRKTYTMNGE